MGLLLGVFINASFLLGIWARPSVNIQIEKVYIFFIFRLNKYKPIYFTIQFFQNAFGYELVVVTPDLGLYYPCANLFDDQIKHAALEDGNGELPVAVNCRNIKGFDFTIITVKTNFCYLFTLSNAKRVIGLAASATSKGPQVKTTEPMDSIKVTNCSTIRFNFSTWRFCQKLHGVSSRGQKVRFFHLVGVDGGMDGWMDVIVFFVHDFFYTVELIEMKWKTYHYFNKI